MRRAAYILGLPILLLAAGPAAAKEVSAAKVCGANGCHEVKDRTLLAAMPEGGPPAPPPKHPSGWYRATLTVRAGDARDRFDVQVVLGSRYFGGNYDPAVGQYMWSHMADDTAAAYRRITRGLEPFPASTLRGLHPHPLRAQVAEVVAPPAEPEPAGGGFPWLWTALGTAAALLAAAGATAVRRRRTDAGPEPRAAES
jgi:hypothetical protein